MLFFLYSSCSNVIQLSKPENSDVLGFSFSFTFHNPINLQVILILSPKNFPNLSLISIPTSNSLHDFPDILQVSSLAS